MGRVNEYDFAMGWRSFGRQSTTRWCPGSFLNFSSHLLGFSCSAETQVINFRFLLATSQSGGPLPASYGHNAPIGVFQALDSGTRTRTFVEPVSRPDLMAIGRNITASFRLFQSSMHRSMARLFGPLTRHDSACEARLCLPAIPFIPLRHDLLVGLTGAHWPSPPSLAATAQIVAPPRSL